MAVRADRSRTWTPVEVLQERMVLVTALVALDRWVQGLQAPDHESDDGGDGDGFSAAADAAWDDDAAAARDPA